MQILLTIEAQAMQAQESAPAVQAQPSVDTTASNVFDDGASNGELANAIAETEFEFDTDDSTVIDKSPPNGGELFSSDGQLVCKTDFDLDNSDVDISISASDDSEDRFETDMGEQTNNEKLLPQIWTTQLADSEDCFLNLLENPTNDIVTDDDRIEAVYRAVHRSLFR